MLLKQYILHEIEHHPALPTEPQEPLIVQTLAHDMPDIYKCLHQGTFGYWNHIPSAEFFRKHLADDYYKVEASSSSPVLESVSPDDSILRVNLRPYKALFPDDEEEAFFMLEKLVLDSAMVQKGSVRRFFDALKAFRELNDRALLIIDHRRYVIPPKRVDQFLIEMRKFLDQHRTLPLFSHSAVYHKLNQPSYVVADLAVLERSPLASLLDHPVG